MPKVITCSQCQASLGVTEEMVGKTVRCPQCGATFPVPGETGIMAQTTPPPLPSRVEPTGPAEPEDAPRRPRFERDFDEEERDYGPLTRLDPAWRTVRSGINLMYIGILAIVLTAVVGVGLMVAAAAVRGMVGRPGPPDPLMVLFLGLICLIALAVLGGGITYLVGLVMGLAIPEPRLRGYLLGTLLCLVLSVVLGIFQGIVQNAMVAGGGGARPAIIFAGFTLLGNLLSMASLVLLILYLRGIAQYFANEPLARSCMNYLIFSFSLMGIMMGLGAVIFLAGFNPMAGGPIGPGGFIGGQPQPMGLALVAMPLAMIAFVGGLVAFFWFMGLLRQTRGTIDQALEGGAVMRGRYY